MNAQYRRCSTRSFRRAQCLAAPGTEKVPQYLTAGRGPNRPFNDGPVVAGRLVEKPRPMGDGPALEIASAVNQTRDPSQTDCPGAHGTRLKRNDQGTPDEAFVPENLGAGAQHQHLRMGGRVFQFDNPVARDGQTLTVSFWFGLWSLYPFYLTN